MSNINPRYPNPRRSRARRWTSEAYTEDILAESGRRTLTLSETRRAAVLRVLLAEAAHLRALSLRAARWPVSWLRPIAEFFGLHVIVAVAVAATVAIAIASYVLFGGARLSAGATLNGAASVSEHRLGPFGLQWNVAQPADMFTNYALHRGDVIVANAPVTITYADGSRIVVSTGSHFSLLADGDGIRLIDGELASNITPRASDAAQYRVETPNGTMAVKGTEFRVHADSAGVAEFSDAGSVTVMSNVGTINVSTGEQVRLNAGTKPTIELQVPRMTFETRATANVISNKPRISFETRIYPGATLVVVDTGTGHELARYTADATGKVRDALPEIADAATLQFRQTASDGRVSAWSGNINVSVDHTPPTLAITQARRDGDIVHLMGRTELKAEVRIDGKRADVNADGTFTVDLDLKSSTTMVEITAIDLAGNTTTMTQALR